MYMYVLKTSNMHVSTLPICHNALFLYVWFSYMALFPAVNFTT